MKKSQKPEFSFAGTEDPEKLRQNAEAVKREFAEPSGKEETKSTTIRLPVPLLTRARTAVVQQKAVDGDYRTLTALIERGLALALDELEQEK